MKTTRTRAPNWLGKVAKEKFLTLSKGLPELDHFQADLLAMMSDAFETYVSAGRELQAHIDATNSMTVPGSTGQPTEHPSLKMQAKAAATYKALYAQLRQSLGKSEPQSVRLEVDELEALMGSLPQ